MMTRAAGAGRLFEKPCAFVAGAPSPRELPAPGMPEIAFAGRSNCGKSSLINALVGRRALARASRTPGRTRSINLFDLGGHLLLVDLPGYGYARAARDEARRWRETVEAYLETRATLRRVCLLIDARRGLMASDRSMCDLLDGAAAAYRVVFTKCDKLGAGALEAAVEAAGREIRRRPAACGEILALSARTGRGIDALRLDLAALAGRPGLA